MAQPSVFLQLVQNLLCVVLICLVTYVASTVLVECEEKRRRRERRLRQRRFQQKAGKLSSMSRGSHASRCSGADRSTKNSFIAAPPLSASNNSTENGEPKMAVAKPSLSVADVSRTQSMPSIDSKNRRLVSHTSNAESESSSEER